MSEHVFISDMKVSDNISGHYIMSKVDVRVTNKNKPYLSATISDRSGSIDLMYWSYSGEVTEQDVGKIIRVQGKVGEYKGALQITGEKVQRVEEGEDVDLSVLVPVAPIDVDAYYDDIEQILQTMEDEDYKTLCQEMLRRHRDEFLRIPAAKSVHHSFLHGLLMHTGNMLKVANFYAGLYGSFINRDLLLAGTLLHDFAKSKEFSVSELGLVTDYTAQGDMLGHLVMGAMDVANLAKELGIPEEKSFLLQHMLLSHHGQPELGAAVRPCIAESELLHLIDKTDATMEIYREAYEKMEVGTFSSRIFALDKKVYRHQ